MLENIMFVNRKKELELLNNEYKKQDSSFTVIYGRRRIGKTALITEYIKDKRAIYFYATESKLNLQLERLTEQAANFFDKEYIKQLKFSDFEQFFIFFSENITGNKKSILVIDEYQNLPLLDKSFSSMLQKVWDLYLKDKNVHLILCGSIISMMHSEVLDYSSPLYGRRTSNIHLKELKFKHITSFIKNLNPIDQMNVYSSFGTVPKYLELYEGNKSFYNNIKDNMLDKNSYLYHEVKFLLKEEIKDINTYFSILEAISFGNRKIGKIAGKINVNTSHLTRYLMKLIDLNIIEKEIPVTEKNPLKSKFGRYRIKDSFINFWFYYIYKNYSYLEIGNIDFVLSEIKRTFNERFVSFCFEDYVKEIISDNPLNYLGFVPQKTGRWWNNREEIDLIAIGEKNITFIECKWNNQKVGYEVIENLMIKSSNVVYPNIEKLNKIFVIFSKAGFKENLKSSDNIKLFSYLE